MKILYQFVILMILIGFILIFSACVSPFKGRIDETSFFSNYHYELSIQSSVLTKNLTLYLPLPVLNGTPKIGTLFLTAETFSNETYIHGTLPPNFHSSIENEDDVPYLKITADAMIPDQGYHFYYDENVHSPAYTYRVNTRFPLGNESVFLPKYNLSEYDHLPAKINYTTRIYADYQMEGFGTLDIMNILTASNWWYLTSDASIGNNYGDSFYFQIYDDSYGWHSVESSINIGNGRYPD
jgi:hypothetical protein